MTIINILLLSVRGWTLAVRIWCLQTSDSDPRSVRVMSTTWSFSVFSSTCAPSLFKVKHRHTDFFRNLDKQNWVIFSHLKLWIAVARHNFRRVKIKCNISATRVSATRRRGFSDNNRANTADFNNYSHCHIKTRAWSRSQVYGLLDLLIYPRNIATLQCLELRGT